MKKIFLFISFFLLISCGYQPIFSSKDSNFLIKEINFDTSDKISSKIKNGLNYLTSVEEYTKIYILKLNSKKTIETTSKDKKGNSLSYKSTINTNLKIFSNNQLIKEANISKSFNYQNISNKFNLKEYEKIIEKNLIDKITEDITLILYKN
tara:strand:- start:68 stop:520 length:453 start_codon:yes stop_codon:yes gene_type:complete